MAKDKKSVLLYCDIIHTIEKMDNATAGEFFKHYLRYINDLNPTTDNIVVDIAFESVKQTLKRDLKKYENICKRNASNGEKGGRPKKPKEPSGLIKNPEKPKKADNDNDTDTDTDTDTVTDNEILIDVDVIEKNYTNDKNLINAVCKSQKITEKVLLSRLKEFTLHLKSQGRKIEKDLEYKRYFLNWLRTKQKTKGIKPSQQSKRYNVI